MKKIVALILVALMPLSLFSCVGKIFNNSFKVSKQAFDLITESYIATNEFSEDIYEAWYLGVNKSSYYNDDNEIKYFADEMHIEIEHIKQAVANLLGKTEYEYSDWSTLSYMYNKNYFSAWVSVISEAYECSGKTKSIENNLNEAKDLMKRLSDKYSDYEHYPVLKEYFTNTIAFLDFCRSPEGSFEQVVETFNTYRNNAREYFFDLNYIFNDNINGMKDYIQ